jgi:hypothetical protein
VRHRAWAMLLVIPAAMFAVMRLTIPFSNFFQHLSLAGTPDRFAATVVRAGRSNARASLWIDNVFVLSWVLVIPRLLRIGSQRWAPERRRMHGRWRAAPRVALLAASVDLIENIFSLALVGKRQPSTGLTLTITTLAWVKWMLYVWALAALLALVIGPLLAPVIRPLMRKLFSPLDRLAGTHPPDAESPDSSSPDSTDAAENGASASAPTIGICLSGGGIRAASVALGALRRFDAPLVEGRSLFMRARWLVAVSGGGYAAGGWRATRRVGNGVEPLATEHRDGLFDADHPWAATVRARRRFLDNGTLSIAGGVINAAARTVLVLGAIASALYLIGRVAGRVVRTRALHQFFPYTDLAGEQRLAWRDLVPLRLVLPGALLLLVAATLMLIAFSTASASRRERLRGPTTMALIAGLTQLVAVVAVPAAVIYGRDLLADLPVGGSAEAGAGVLGALSLLGVFAAIAGVVIARLKRRWMYVGGALLACAALLFVGKIADTFAYGYDGIWQSIWWAIGAAVWLIAVDAVASHRLTLGGMYRKRLAATFVTADGSAAPLSPLPYSAEPGWDSYARAAGPELVIAATAHSTAPTFCGVAAFGFSFRPTSVTLYDRAGSDPDSQSAQAPVAMYPQGSWWDGFPRGWIVTRSMALSGAAFASAMGRQALGSTNALLVALNLRLGAWVPNPRFVHWFADPVTSPRVHLGYLVKELFNRYHPDRDPFVYVADGGHRENLGLVELLRERPDVVFCVDASGDTPRSMQTLREAIELARVELGIDIDIDLGRLQAAAGVLPVDCVAEGVIRYPASEGPARPTARLVYGRAQLNEAAQPDLLRYGAIDDRFPDYSTADQYLTDIEHLQLVALGEHVADRIVARYEAGNE